jgi:hypothetical protein
LYLSITAADAAPRGFSRRRKFDAIGRTRGALARRHAEIS